MAVTSPWSIPLVDASNQAQLDALLNAHANALNTALTSLQSGVASSVGAGANLYKGTASARNAFTTATNGQLWQDTDGSMGLYRRQGGAWMRLVDGNATPFATAAGSVGAVTIVSTGDHSESVTFPAGRFTVPPIVTVTNTSGFRDINCWAQSVTKDGFTLRRGSVSTVTRAGIAAQWQAVQMTPTTAAG